MKRLGLLLCCALLLSAPALAQVPGFSVGYGVHGNALNFNTQGYANDIYGLGLGGGIHLDLGTPIIGVRISGDYIFLNPDKDKYSNFAASMLGSLAQGASIDGGKIEVYMANANAKLVLLPLPIIHVYATGGVGLAKITVNDATIHLPVLGITRSLTKDEIAKLLGLDSQTKMTANAGAGVDLGLGPITLFGELKLNWIFTDPHTTSMVPIGTVGITF